MDDDELIAAIASGDGDDTALRERERRAPAGGRRDRRTAGCPGQDQAGGRGRWGARGRRYLHRNADALHHRNAAAFSYMYYAFLYPPWNDVAIPNDANDASWNSEFQQQFLMTFVAQPNSSPLSATQDAVVTALMAVAGSPAHVFQGEGGGKVGGGH
jgi:hypothetical protein